MLRAAGNPFMHDAHGRQIPGREHNKNKHIPKACSTTVAQGALFMDGSAQQIVDNARVISSLQQKQVGVRHQAKHNLPFPQATTSTRSRSPARRTEHSSPRRRSPARRIKHSSPRRRSPAKRTKHSSPRHTSRNPAKRTEHKSPRRTSAAQPSVPVRVPHAPATTTQLRRF